MDLSSRLTDAYDRMRRRKTRRRAAQDFLRSLALIVDSEALEASVAARLRELFDPGLLVILRLDTATAEYRPSFCSGFLRIDLEDVVVVPGGRLARWFLANETCLLVARDRGVVNYLDPGERELLRRLNARLCAPLLARNHLLGILLLGAGERDWNPRRRDGELLQQLANQASLAFQNAALYREQKERLDRLHRADRLAAAGHLAAGVAHEVRNPLTAIRSTMQYLARSFEDESRQEMVQELIDEVDRIDNTIDGLLSLTRAGELESEDVDLVALLAQTVRLMEPQARRQSVTFAELYGQSPLRVVADAGQLRQVFLNLILNALQAMPEGGRITLAARLEQPSPATPEARWAHLSIVDTGQGISPDQLKAVFDPFFTTKSEGTGLGLAICHGIVERHGGQIELQSKEGEGTTVSIRLPVGSVNDHGVKNMSRGE